MASIIWLCAGCQPPEPGNGEPGNGRLTLDPVARWTDGGLEIETGIDFQPSPAIREALEHGVDLQLDVEVRVSRRHGPIARELARPTQALRIRFLPLVEHWQLEDGSGVQTFPRFWMLREALAVPRAFESGVTRIETAQRPLQVQIRVRINRDALPAPMHLPTLFSAQWHLGERWHSWHFGPS